MATAFQPNAFQNDAFQIEKARVRGGSSSSGIARRQIFKNADLLIKEKSDDLKFQAILEKIANINLKLTEKKDIFQGAIAYGRQMLLSIKEKADYFNIGFELGLNLQRDEEEFLIMLFSGSTK
jgi:hypothetical protein